MAISRLTAGYGLVRALEDISLSVSHAETVVLLGTNGNGKSTLMKCIMGMVRPSSGAIVAEIDGKRHDLVGCTTEAIVDLGITLVPEGRRLFPKLTVEENLLLGAFRPTARSAIAANLESSYATFLLSYRRRPVSTARWIPACAGMTIQADDCGAADPDRMQLNTGGSRFT